MYKVYADDVLIHDSYSPEKDIHLIDPLLKIGDTVAGSFDFTCPPNSPGYDAIVKFATTIIVKKKNTIIWTGRVITESEDFWKKRKFTCEGALAFLNDSIQPLNYYKQVGYAAFFRALIRNHNDRVESNRQFTIGSTTANDTNDPRYYKTNYESTLTVIKNQLVDVFGGHIRIRYNGNDPTPIIDYLGDYPNTAVQEINFGENLLDFTKNWDLSKLFTVIIPRGAQLEEENIEGDKDYLTIASVNGGSIYLQNDDAIATYGKVETVVDFNDVEDAYKLKTLGEAYLSSTQFDDMVLHVSAIDLNMITDSVVSFNLLDRVKCKSKPHGLDRYFPITEISIPLDKPDGVEYTMGTTVVSTISGKSAVNMSSGEVFKNYIKDVIITSLDDAKENAASLINSKTSGYINIITEDGVSTSLVISNKPDIEESDKLWRFNIEGLGYSNNGGRSYSMALTTSDGTIIADRIKTGILSDGPGYNFWNMQTGEFTMAYNTIITNSSQTQSVTIEDVIEVVNDHDIDINNNTAVINTNTAKITKVARREYGTYNLLRGTNSRMTYKTSGSGEWSRGEWDPTTGSSAHKDMVDVSGTPNSAIVKGFQISVITSTNNPTFISQRNVVVSPSQVYVVSCYAKTSYNPTMNPAPTIYMRVGKQVASSTAGYAIASTQMKTDSKWHRYMFSFMTSGNNSWTNQDISDKHAYIADNKIDVMFGFSGHHSTTFTLAGMALERGNIATDWSESEWDTNDFSSYTANQEVGKLNNTLNNKEIFKRLISGNAAQGLYMTDGSLLINASYIKTGLMDAKLIRTGIITDKTGKTKWDLDKSILSTSNINVTGGSITLKNGNQTVAMNSTGFTAGTGNTFTYGSVGGAGNTNGLVIGAKQGIELISPKIRVLNKAYYGKLNYGDFEKLRTGLTKEVKLETIQWIRDSGNSISWQPQTIWFTIVNGLIVEISVSNGSWNSYYDSTDVYDEDAMTPED